MDVSDEEGARMALITLTSGDLVRLRQCERNFTEFASAVRGCYLRVQMENAKLISRVMGVVQEQSFQEHKLHRQIYLPFLGYFRLEQILDEPAAAHDFRNFLRVKDQCFKVPSPDFVAEKLTELRGLLGENWRREANGIFVDRVLGEIGNGQVPNAVEKQNEEAMEHTNGELAGREVADLAKVHCVDEHEVDEEEMAYGDSEAEGRRRRLGASATADEDEKVSISLARQFGLQLEAEEEEEENGEGEGGGNVSDGAESGEIASSSSSLAGEEDRGIGAGGGKQKGRKANEDKGKKTKAKTQSSEQQQKEQQRGQRKEQQAAADGSSDSDEVDSRERLASVVLELDQLNEFLRLTEQGKGESAASGCLLMFEMDGTEQPLFMEISSIFDETIYFVNNLTFRLDEIKHHNPGVDERAFGHWQKDSKMMKNPPKFSTLRPKLEHFKRELALAKAGNKMVDKESLNELAGQQSAKGIAFRILVSPKKLQKLRRLGQEQFRKIARGLFVPRRKNNLSQMLPFQLLASQIRDVTFVPRQPGQRVHGQQRLNVMLHFANGDSTEMPLAEEENGGGELTTAQMRRALKNMADSGCKLPSAEFIEQKEAELAEAMDKLKRLRKPGQGDQQQQNHQLTQQQAGATFAFAHQQLGSSPTVSLKTTVPDRSIFTQSAANFTSAAPSNSNKIFSPSIGWNFASSQPITTDSGGPYQAQPMASSSPWAFANNQSGGGSHQNIPAYYSAGGAFQQQNSSSKFTHRVALDLPPLVSSSSCSLASLQYPPGALLNCSSNVVEQQQHISNNKSLICQSVTGCLSDGTLLTETGARALNFGKQRRKRAGQQKNFSLKTLFSGNTFTKQQRKQAHSSQQRPKRNKPGPADDEAEE